jgi:hypothetical protein
MDVEMALKPLPDETPRYEMFEVGIGLAGVVWPLLGGAVVGVLLSLL